MARGELNSDIVNRQDRSHRRCPSRLGAPGQAQPTFFRSSVDEDVLHVVSKREGLVI